MVRATSASEGRTLTLEKHLLTQLLGDQAVYQECPEFLFMREMALDAYGRYMALMNSTQPSPSGCKGCSNRKTMDPAIQAFLLHTKKLYDENRELLKPLRRFLSKRLGYEPVAIVFYHRSKQGLQRIQF